VKFETPYFYIQSDLRIGVTKSTLCLSVSGAVGGCRSAMKYPMEYYSFEC
jgi:hypothetical protein